MKLIGDNVGRTIISTSNPSQGITTQQNVVTSEPLILDQDGASIQSSGSTGFNQGTGFFLGIVNGIPVFSLGSADQGMSWDGETLNVIGTLEALSAIISGSVQIGDGGEIFSNMTSFASGTGFWLGTDASGNPQFALIDQFGNYIIFDGSTSNALAISSTGVVNVLSSIQIDDGQWAQSAIWGGIGSTPTTLSGFGITDGQQLIANASDVAQVLRRDNGGPIYCGYQYTGETNIIALGGADFVPNGDQTLTTSMANFGNTINIPNPGQSVSVSVAASLGFFASGGTGDACLYQVQISFDGGSTWTTSTQQGATRIFALSEVHGSTTCFFQKTGTPSADIQVRVQASKSGAAGTDKAQAASSGIEIKVFQNSTYSIAGNLSSTLPGTSTMNCSSVYPSTTCTANKSLTVVLGGGLPPYTYAWAKVSGTGSISAGSTTKTATISDTETTTSGGATHTTTVNCTITDSQTYTPTAGSDAANVATVTIGSHQIPVGAVVDITGCTPAAYNVSGATVTAVTTTQIKYATATTPGAMTVFGTVNNVRVTSGNCVITGTFTLTFAAISASITTTAGSCSTGITCGSTCTAHGSAKATASGGNGSYTYSWSVTSGGATITSGSTSQTCNFSDSQATSSPFSSDPSGVKCAVNDSRGTGVFNATGTVGFKFICTGP